MPKPVTIYTAAYCPHCARAKKILSSKGISFKEVDVTDDDQKRQEAQDKYGWMTVPIIVIGNKCIGGADELADLDRKGKLERLIESS